MSKINAEWHQTHPMPKNASDDQRIAWHVEHVQNCNCRGIPKGVLTLMTERGIATPDGYDTSRK